MSEQIKKQETGTTSVRTPFGCAMNFLGALLALWASMFLLLVLGIGVWRALKPAGSEVSNAGSTVSPTVESPNRPIASSTPAQFATPVAPSASATASPQLPPEITIGPAPTVLPGTPTPTLVPLPTITIEFPTPTVHTGLYLLERRQGSSDLVKQAEPSPPIFTSPLWVLMLVGAIWLFLLVGFFLFQWFHLQ